METPNPKTLSDVTQIEQEQPGLQHEMETQPVSAQLPDELGQHGENGYPVLKPYRAADKLKDCVALITGGDSGIGRAVSVLFAKEGADVAVIHLPKEAKDARDTKRLIEKEGRECLLFATDVGYYENCLSSVQAVVKKFGRIDILVNNAGEQHVSDTLEHVLPEQIEKTFRTNVFGYFYMTKASLPHMKKGAKIINTTSVVAYRGSPSLLDYSASKGAEVSFTRNLAKQLGSRGIRVNGVAPGPIVTPLQNVSRDQKNLYQFLRDEPLLGRVGQPSEVATCYVFLASDDSSYMTGQMLHPNGGEIVNG